MRLVVLIADYGVVHCHHNKYLDSIYHEYLIMPSTATKKSRLSRKLFKAGLAAQRAAKEGVLYEAGGF